MAMNSRIPVVHVVTYVYHTAGHEKYLQHYSLQCWLVSFVGATLSVTRMLHAGITVAWYSQAWAGWP